MAFTYLKVKSAKVLFTSCGLGVVIFGLGLVSLGLGLVLLVLVLRIWSCLHHWIFIR